jgi:1-acyl-sn-glycerol-3-phosphate acyltransferase
MTARSSDSRPPGSEAHVPAALRLVYGVYVWIVFTALAMSAVAGMIAPGLERRRRIARGAARALLRIAGMPLTVKSEHRIPAGPCVIVANHASYLDGLVMMAALPPRFGFVIKREMSKVPLANVLLRRIGSHFVERFNRHRGATDARRLMRTVSGGHSLVFFPEGTFNPEPGLLKFHTGAFAIAARAGCPVVPAVLRGTRSALPPRNPLPNPGAIELEFLAPILAQAESADDAAVELRDRSRAAILSELDEPDLAAA